MYNTEVLYTLKCYPHLSFLPAITRTPYQTAICKTTRHVQIRGNGSSELLMNCHLIILMCLAFSILCRCSPILIHMWDTQSHSCTVIRVRWGCFGNVMSVPPVTSINSGKPHLHYIARVDLVSTLMTARLLNLSLSGTDPDQGLQKYSRRT